MRDSRLLIAAIGAILVSICSSNSQSFDGSGADEQLRMASESLVVKSYKEAESSTVSTTKALGQRLEEYQVYQGVMGRPGIDFPVYPYIPATNFNCRGVKKSGYYADLATDCQVFHICDGNRKISFLCPNGTIFRQSHLICDWWFRVDCRKSVELYEESAEQLAADQKIYKARSEERERRRKQGKTVAGENGGELTSAEVYALEEPFQHKQGKKQEEQFVPTTRLPPVRFDGRKPERHSKKVADSGITEKFPNYSKEKQNGKVTEKIRTSKERQGDVRQYSTPVPVTPEPQTRVTFFQNAVTTPVYTTPKSRYHVQNAINYVRNKENIQLAESGSLVEDLNRKNGNFAFNASQGFQVNNQNRNNYNFAYNNNKRPEEQTRDFNNNNNNRERNQNFVYSDNKRVNQTLEFRNDFVYNDNKRNEPSPGDNANGGRNINFAYTENKNLDQTFLVNNGNGNGNVNFGFNEQTAGGHAFEERARNGFLQGDKSSENKKLDESDIGVTAFTTEFFNYESKRTNPVERQETVTPTAYTRKSQSARYRSSTAPYSEQDKQEKQYFAETASFASNRGGKSYSEYQNQFNTYNKGVVTTTPNAYRTTFYTTSRPTEAIPTTQTPPSQRFTSQNYNQGNTDYFRTTTYRPIKQNSRKVTIYPSTNPQTAFTTRIWQTTTSPPYVETTTNEKFTVDDIYFTTSTPEREIEIFTETQGPQKETEIQTGYENFPSTPKPEVDITLQELNINKNPTQTEAAIKSYDDFVREGLEVPPSSGPNAIRSFALYFATTNNNEEAKTTSYIPPREGEPTTTLSPFEIRKKELVKAVDELVQRSSANVSDRVSHTEEALPNSLTPHTKDSYSALFPEQPTENHTSPSTTERAEGSTTVNDFETTALESFTEEPNRINKELTKNDLDGSQSRGLVEPDPHSDVDYSKVSPDLRELAQVFTKALSAYLDDPETFRKVLSEIRPTEPTVDSEVSSSNPIEYPSATQEDDEVLDFSDVTKASYKKKTSTASVFRETTTEYFTEAPTTNLNEIENYVLPVNQSNWATNIELTAPFFESLDQSQSNYYTPPPFTGTTNAIAEEINNEFTVSDRFSSSESNDTVDSYLPIRGSVDDPSIPRYGGFQNNSKSTTKYSPYGAELTSTPYVPYGADLTPTATTQPAATTIDENRVTTFNPNNVTSFFSHFSRNDSEEGEIQLAKELNNLVLLQKFTTPRGAPKETTTEPNLSTAHLSVQNDIDQYQDVKLGNGEVLEKTVRERAGKSLHFPESSITSNHFEPDAKEINLELSPPSSTPKGFLITYSLSGASSSEPATYLPKATTPEVQPTTYSPVRQTIFSFASETNPPVENTNYDDFSRRVTNSRSGTEYFTTTFAPTTFSFGKSTKSVDRLAQLQETLMFNTSDLTLQQRNQARVSVEEMMDTLNMTDSTADTLMKVMEMAAKNETYRRLVLLLVNDKSGRNKTVEEARLSLLKALLTPVINPHQTRTVLPIPETSRLIQTETRGRTNLRRSKSIKSDSTANLARATTTTETPTHKPTQRTPSGRAGRRGKTGRGLTRAESNYKSGLGNLGVIRRTIENSKNKQVRVNSVDDAILDSDSRAVELLRSLYSLAARWG